MATEGDIMKTATIIRRNHRLSADAASELREDDKWAGFCRRANDAKWLTMAHGSYDAAELLAR